jgi:L-ribulose-5-phosphate 4-epimerase
MGLMTEALAPQGLPLGEELRDRHFLRKHGAGAYYGQPRSPRS